MQAGPGCTLHSTNRVSRATSGCLLKIKTSLKDSTSGIYQLYAPVCIMQWNPSNLDTNGTEESVRISEVSLFHGKLHARTVLGEREVFLLERCPRYRSVLIESFCGIYTLYGHCNI